MEEVLEVDCSNLINFSRTFAKLFGVNPPLKDSDTGRPEPGREHPPGFYRRFFGF
jgi:hypothetical protein